MKAFILPTKSALKQNIPLFQENFLGYKSRLKPGLVFSKEITSSLLPMYPYPVSGFVGTIIPKVQYIPETLSMASGLLFIQISSIIWSDG
jgi:hypothetical protein